MKRIALRWLGALLLSITLAAPALAAGKHLINGIDANYPPFAYVDETGKPAGFDVDSMNWIAKKMGFTVEHKPMDWDGIIPALLAKKIDMVCSGMSISPERKAQANFSDPYWTIRKIFITKKGSKVTEDQIYNGKIKLGVQRGTNEQGDGLRIFLGVTDDRGLNDIGELTGAVRYDGQTLSLNPAELTYQEIA